MRDVCTGTNAGITAPKGSAERKLQALRNRYENCQYVDGNLEITGLDSEEYYNADLSFLNSIREVTGYVLIANVYVQNVTLENLTIIRGDTLFEIEETSNGNSSSSINSGGQTSRGYALFISFNYRKDSDSIGMRLLGLRNLTGEVILIIVYIYFINSVGIWLDPVQNSSGVWTALIDTYLRSICCHGCCITVILLDLLYIEISNGDVFFENNNLLCYAMSDVYWSDIFADGDRQRVSFIHDTVRNSQPCK